LSLPSSSSEPGAPPGADGRFDGALADFGVLNCVEDLGGVARALGELLRPGAMLVACVMGPLAPWEWGWFLARGRPREAFRRLAPGGARWRGMRVRYPGPGRLGRVFAPGFRVRRTAALGALVPPGFAAGCRRAGLDPLALALGGGEDYELLFTVRPGGPSPALLAARLGLPVAGIGRAVPRAPGRSRAPRGWRHLPGPG
jgi:hypothetical protein